MVSLKKWLGFLGVMLLFWGCLVSSDLFAFSKQFNLEMRVSPSSRSLSGKFQKDITIKMYKKGSSKPLWSERHTSVTVTNGTFKILVGSIDPVGNPIRSEFFNDDLQFSVTLDGEEAFWEFNPGAVFSLKSLVAEKALAVDWHNVSNRPTDLSAFSKAVSANIQDGAVTFSKIAQESATSGQIIKWNGTAWVAANDDGGVSYQAGTGLVLSGSVFSVKDAGVTAAKLATDSVTVTKIQDGAVSGVKLKDGDISAVKLADESITSAKILDGAIVTGDLADNSITSEKIVNGTIKNEDIIADAAIPYSKLSIAKADLLGLGMASQDMITTNATKLQQRSILNTEPSSGQVLKWNGTAWAPAADSGTTYFAGTGLSLADSTFSLSDGGISSDKLGNDSVLSTKLAANAVTSSKIQDGTITNTDISETAAISFSKLLITKSDVLGLHVLDDVVTTTNATKLQQRDVSATAPSTGQVLKWTGTAWAPADETGSGASYTASSGISLLSNNFFLTDLGVTNGKLADGAVGFSKLADSSVGSSKIADNSIVDSDINAFAAISFSKLAISKQNLVNLGLASQEMVTTNATKLQLRPISSVSPDSGQVLKWTGNAWTPSAETQYLAGSGLSLSGTTFSVGIGQVTSSNLASDSVTSVKILDGTITNADIASGASIPFSKLSISKSDLSLGNVDNTADVNKPVSIAQQAALDLKANLSLLSSYILKTATSNYETAYMDRLKWDGSVSGLNVLAARSSLGLGSIATRNQTDFVTTSNFTQQLTGLVLATRTVNGHPLSSDVTVTKGDLELDNVENIALSTWGGSANLATVGTITAGTWNGSALADAYVSDGITLTNLSQITNRAISDTTGTLLLNRGGTGGTTASEARINLGLGSIATRNQTDFVTTSNLTTQLGNYVPNGALSGYVLKSATTNYEIAYTDRLKWDGGVSGLNVLAARSSLGLGSIATRNQTDFVTTSNFTQQLTGLVLATRTVNGHPLSSDVTVTKGDLELDNVENTALSTWQGSSNLTTLGTLTSQLKGASADFSATVTANAVDIRAASRFRAGVKIDKEVSFTLVNVTATGPATSLDFTQGLKQVLTLSTNSTLSFAAPSGPCVVTLLVKQDATGSRSVTWPASVKWPSGVSPLLSAGSNAVDIVTLIYDGTNYYGLVAYNFQ